jgi:hypothetical protein
MNRLTTVACALGILAAHAGCGDGKTSVEGTVSLDGQPIKAGSIVFVGEKPPLREGGVITDGRFQTRLPPGTYVLELSGTRIAGTRKQKGFDGKEETIQEIEEVFPEHLRSGLKQEITPGPNTVTLDLKSKK